MLLVVGWHHRLDGHEFEQALGVVDGHGSLACYSPWDRKELDMTEPLNNKILFLMIVNDTLNLPDPLVSWVSCLLMCFKALQYLRCLEIFSRERRTINLCLKKLHL